MQPIKELSSAAGRHVGMGCAIIGQLTKLTPALNKVGINNAADKRTRNQYTRKPENVSGTCVCMVIWYQFLSGIPDSGTG